MPKKKHAAEPTGAPPAPESATGATGRRMGGEEPLVLQSHGGALKPHQPGSNGGVHRGRDRTPRVNVCRAMFMKALAGTQVRLFKVDGKKKRVRVEVEMAMTQDLVERVQKIAETGSNKDVLKLLEIMDKTFRMQPHEKNAEHQTPRPPTFVRPGTLEEPAAEEPPSNPGSVDVGGREYTDAGRI